MEIVGQRNLYQKLIVVVTVLIYFIATFNFMVLPYYVSTPSFQCQNEQGKWSDCTEDNGACDKNIISRPLQDKNETISLQYDLYCDKRTFRTILQSIPYIASIVGLFLFNYISDNKGRCFALRICYSLGCIFTFMYNFSNSPILFAISSFGMGLTMSPSTVIIIVILNEVSNGKFRDIAMIMLYVVWSLNEMQYIWMIKVFPNWKYCMLYFFSIPFAICSIIPFFLQDSPRFLYQKNKYKCLQQLNKIAKFNKRQTIEQNQLQEEGSQIAVNRIYSYLDLFIYPSQRKNTLLLLILFIVPHIMYYGIQISLDQVGTSFEVNSLYIGIGEFVGYFLSDIFSYKIKRRFGCFLSLIASCLFLLSFYFINIPSQCVNKDNTCWQKSIQTLIIALSRCVLSLTFSLMILLCGEIYPITIKSIGYGFNFALGCVGSFLSPYIVDFSNKIGINPMISLGLISFFGSFSVLFLKETLGNEQIQQIPEIMEKWTTQK